MSKRTPRYTPNRRETAEEADKAWQYVTRYELVRIEVDAVRVYCSCGHSDDTSPARVEDARARRHIETECASCGQRLKAKSGEPRTPKRDREPRAPRLDVLQGGQPGDEIKRGDN